MLYFVFCFVQHYYALRDIIIKSFLRYSAVLLKGGFLSNSEKKLLKILLSKINNLSVKMEKMKLAEYIKLLDNPWRLMYVNFISGLARGVGIAIGFTILGAVVLYFLRILVVLNLPLIGDFIAEIVRLVQLKVGM